MVITVLLADDHGVLRDGLRDLLETQSDIKVVASVGDGHEAVRLAGELKPEVAILDVAMPGLTGIEATRALLEASPRTAVVVLSYHAELEMAEEAFRAGARGYVQKASAGTEVVRAVRVVISGRRYVGAGMPNSVVGDASGAPARKPRSGRLTDRERHILRLVADGKTSAQIATELGLSPRTVETYRLRLMEKLGIEDLPSLIKYAIRRGITSTE